MAEAVTGRVGKFLRPLRKEEEKGGERFLKILKKAFQVAFQLLIFSFLIFTGHRAYVHLLKDSFFRVKKVEVEGCKRIEKETVLSLARMEGMPNLFTVSLKEVAKRIEAHPWIGQVAVRKIFPGRMLIRIKERQPIAIIQLDDLYYIDSQGVIFTRVGDGDRCDFPFLTGLTPAILKDKPPEAKNLIMKALELLRLAGRQERSPLENVSEIHMDKIYGIRCFTLDEGVEVRMEWENFEEKLRRLSLIWSDLEKREFSAASIDFNDLKRVAVRKRFPKDCIGKEVKRGG